MNFEREVKRMNEFREFQEAQEQNKENQDAELDAALKNMITKADALIDSTAEMLAKDSDMTKEKILEKVQKEALAELGPGYSKEDLAPLGDDSKAYTPSFGSNENYKWTKHDSTIKCTANEMVRAAESGNKIAVDNRKKEIEALNDKRKADLEKKEAEKKAARMKEKMKKTEAKN